jgi:hypothetical protein
VFWFKILLSSLCVVRTCIDGSGEMERVLLLLKMHPAHIHVCEEGGERVVCYYSILCSYGIK